MNERGQIAIFVIIALVVVGAVVVFLVVRGRVGPEAIPVEFEGIYQQYDNCIEAEAKAAIDLTGSQGGRIFLDEYSPGSEFSPFSNQLNFLGFPVPYWYYLSGNGIIKQSVPTKEDMEEEIARYVKNRVNECDFDRFYSQGFYIDLEEPEVDVRVEDTKVFVSVAGNVVASKEDRSASKREHEVEVASKLGKFYGIARDIYDEEIDSAFLEEYGVDVLRLYAPVDDVEVSCSGKVWKVRDVVSDLRQGLEANIGALKVKGDYYTLSEKEKEYYVVPVSSDEAVSFLYNRNWPSRIEIEGADGELLIAEPIGNEAGLGSLGFCYAPYHFVYDISFPVMVQVYDSEEIFQFPVVAVIDNNLPREAELGSVEGAGSVESLCDFATEEIEVNLFDSNLNPVDGFVSYNCFNEECRLGETESGKISANSPACLNGFLNVRAEGFADKSQLFSSNEEKFADVILDREYDVSLSLEVGGKKFDGTAIINFEGEDRTIGASIPGTESVKLTGGQYKVTVYAYSDSNVVIPASTKTECHEAPRTGILGIFGATKEDCYEIELPETKIDYALIGGGETESFITESNLAKGNLIIKVDRFPDVDSLEQLQFNYQSFDSGSVNLEFI